MVSCQWLLREFSLTAENGERIGLLGPSGGGKTTVLRLAAGLTRPDSGEIVRPAGRLAYVFQESRLMPWLTAAGNVTAAAGCSRAEALAVLEDMELADEADSFPDSLSGGMRQRVNIARALAAQPSLLLMDEPFKGLDDALRERVIARILPRLEGCTLLLVTHDRRECEWMGCTQVISFAPDEA